jgi:hypothetical protein
MKEKFRLILSDQFVKVSLMLSILFIVPLITIIVFTYPSLPPLIPFYNSMPWGEDRLANSSISIALPFLILAVFAVNTIQAVISYSKYVLVARILMFNTFLFLLLGLLAYLQILFLTF